MIFCQRKKLGLLTPLFVPSLYIYIDGSYKNKKRLIMLIISTASMNDITTLSLKLLGFRYN